MKTLSFGIVPDDLEISEPYPMKLNKTDHADVAMIVNKGIDSRLEAVFIQVDSTGQVLIQDTSSMKCFLRRCVESENENLWSIAAGIMSTLNYEWI